MPLSAAAVTSRNWNFVGSAFLMSVLCGGPAPDLGLWRRARRPRLRVAATWLDRLVVDDRLDRLSRLRPRRPRKLRAALRPPSCYEFGCDILACACLRQCRWHCVRSLLRFFYVPLGRAVAGPPTVSLEIQPGHSCFASRGSTASPSRVFPVISRVPAQDSHVGLEVL